MARAPSALGARATVLQVHDSPGRVEAADEREAMQKAAEEFKQRPTKLYGVRRLRKERDDIH